MLRSLTLYGMESCFCLSSLKCINSFYQTIQYTKITQATCYVCSNDASIAVLVLISLSKSIEHRAKLPTT